MYSVRYHLYDNLNTKESGFVRIIAMISVEGLNKSYGGFVLFDDVNFKINPKERVGLVGRNGHGKTTLFRIIAGLEAPEAGNVGKPRHYRIGYVTQMIDFTADTVLEEGMRGLPADAAGEHWQVEKILSGLGFSPEDMNSSPREFSGGYQVRLNLAKVLVSRPDLLLLDEPTNYLDITSIRWIKKFLNSWTGELFLITHDRSFMDDVVTHVVGIHRKKTRKVPGDTGKYYANIAQDEEVYEKTRVNDERRRKEIERFVSRFRAKARLANMVQSRMKTLDKMTRNEKLERFKSLDFEFSNRPFTGKYMMRVDDIAFSYDNDAPRPLISDFSITIGSRERICIIGRNGAGKTTLLRMLAGELAPDSGRIETHQNAARGFFEQTNVRSLVDDRTVEEEILYSNPDIGRQGARNICGAMLFEGDTALKKIGVLSGGEKCRVMLGKLLGTPVNFLLLDEPTNHFDMESCDALLAAIDAFDGAVVMVTHNEMFLHALAERLIVFQDGGISVFDGSYQRFLETGGWGDDESVSRASRPAAADTDVEPLNRKEYRRQRSVLISEKGKVLKPVQDEIESLEKTIIKSEAELETLHGKMQEVTATGDGRKIADLSQAIHDCQSRIDHAFDRLEQVSATAETLRADFDARLSAIDDRKPF